MHIRFEDGYPVAGIVFGAICAVLAQGRGRSALAWFVLGFLFNCLALIIVLVLPDLRDEEGRHVRLSEETRRLRERVRLDRHVADRRHEEVQRRLGAHDFALGLDTAPPLPALAMKKPAPVPGPGLPPGAPEVADPADSPENQPPFANLPWFHARDGVQQGPIGFAALRGLWRDGGIDGRTFVWSRGMKEWQRIEELPGLGEALSD